MSNIERHTGAPALGGLSEQMDYAQAVAQAGLVPDSFRAKPANVLIALEIARALDESPWTVMSEMSVIGGKPSFSAKFMRSRVRQAGHKLRESFENDVAKCIIYRADDPEYAHTSEWDEAKARQHGYWGKGHWAKNPELMLKNRALSECVREAAYEVMGGIGYTPDEVADFAGDGTGPSVRRDSSRTPAPAAASNHEKAAAALGIDEQAPADTVDSLLAEVETADGDKDALRALWQRAANLNGEDKAAVRTIIETSIAADPVEAELVEDEPTGDAA